MPALWPSAGDHWVAIAPAAILACVSRRASAPTASGQVLVGSRFESRAKVLDNSVARVPATRGYHESQIDRLATVHRSPARARESCVHLWRPSRTPPDTTPPHQGLLYQRRSRAVAELPPAAERVFERGAEVDENQRRAAVKPWRDAGERVSRFGSAWHRGIASRAATSQPDRACEREGRRLLPRPWLDQQRKPPGSILPIMT